MADDSALKADFNQHLRAGESALFYDSDRGRWRLFVPCAACGGYIVDFRETDLGAEDAVRTEAANWSATLTRGRCLTCEAAAIAADTEGFTEPFMYFAPDEPGWVARLPFSESSGGLTVSLGITLLEDRAVAHAALSLLCQEMPVSLSVAESRAQLSPELPALFFDEARVRWVLWVPCSACGGAELVLSPDSRERAISAAGRAASILAVNGDSPCTACSAQIRAARPISLDEDELAYWYEPGRADWMLALPLEGTTVVMPLEVGFFDIPVPELEALAVSAANGWPVDEAAA